MFPQTEAKKIPIAKLGCLQVFTLTTATLFCTCFLYIKIISFSFWCYGVLQIFLIKEMVNSKKCNNKEKMLWSYEEITWRTNSQFVFWVFLTLFVQSAVSLSSTATQLLTTSMQALSVTVHAKGVLLALALLSFFCVALFYILYNYVLVCLNLCCAILKL